MGSKYKKLNDKHWLENLYINEKKSTIEIAKIIGAKTGNSVRQALERHSIPIRNRIDAQVSESNFLIDNDVLIGSILGDAGLRVSNKNNKKTIPYFYKKNKYLDHIEFVAKSFYGDNYKERIKPDGKYYKFSTPASRDFYELYQKWYPNGKKIIPKDIDITPGILHHWFLDDGCSYLRKRKSRQIVITLSSQCFTPEDQNMVCDVMNEKWNMRFGLEKINDGTGYRIKLPQSEANRFYEIIGPPIIKSLSYKWK